MNKAQLIQMHSSMLIETEKQIKLTVFGGRTLLYRLGQLQAIKRANYTNLTEDWLVYIKNVKF
jgi:hypothetical protein